MSEDRNVWFKTQILVHERELRLFLRRLCSSDDEARDVVQECYAKLFALPSVDHIAIPRAYLFSSARNLALQNLRHERVVPIDRIAEYDDLGMDAVAPSTEQVVSGRQQLQRLSAAITALPPQCRQVFTLRRVYGMSQKEIAANMQIAESTVEKHIAKGVQLCAEALLAASTPAQFGTKANGLNGEQVKGERK